jgi:hypothetical protein
MKKKSILLFMMIGIICLRVSGQVTLEHVYGTYHKSFFLTDLGNNNYKYVIFTENSSIVNLYNLDHSLYLTFSTPVPLWAPPNYPEVMYITSSLFDCDSTKIEYVLTSGAYPAGGFHIYRTDGTLLFSKDSVTGPYCFGCMDGSVNIRPINNTPEGTKLTLFNSDSTWVYSLCGSLPLIIDEHSMTASYVKVFPNPTSGIINFEINPPNNRENFKLTIYNASLQVIEESNISGKDYQLDLSNRSLSSGTYFFDLRTGTKIVQTGKFILAQ